MPGVVQGHQDDVSGEPGIVEKTGSRIPLDISFRNENGSIEKLSDIIRKPTILTLVYFTCDHICPQMLGGLASALADVKLKPGKDYQLITISFDDRDDPSVAKEKKVNYIKATGIPFPEEAWKFLTGSGESIRRITEAFGFHYRRESHGFIHPEVLVFLSPGGKITGYHYVSKYQYGLEYPVTFSAAELTAGIVNASRGTPAFSIRKTVLYCFPHEPAGQERFFRLLSVTGVVTLLSIAAFFVYLKVTGRKS